MSAVGATVSRMRPVTPRRGAPDPARTDGLLVHGASVVHQLPAQTKVVALTLTVAVVVLTPPGAWGVLAAQAALVIGVAAAAHLPAGLVARRLVIEAPFVAFALLLPLIATGPRIDVGPLTLSASGLIGGATLLIKGTVGTLAAIVLAATTPSRDLLAGLERLRLPAVLVAIISFMVRYLVLVADDLQRTQIARISRCGSKASLATVASGVGTRFVRTYERGERVQQAMVARGYTGQMPRLTDAHATSRQWTLAMSLPAAALFVTLVAAVSGWVPGR